MLDTVKPDNSHNNKPTKILVRPCIVYTGTPILHTFALSPFLFSEAIDEDRPQYAKANK